MKSKRGSRIELTQKAIQKHVEKSTKVLSQRLMQDITANVKNIGDDIKQDIERRVEAESRAFMTRVKEKYFELRFSPQGVRREYFDVDKYMNEFRAYFDALVSKFTLEATPKGRIKSMVMSQIAPQLSQITDQEEKAVSSMWFTPPKVHPQRFAPKYASKEETGEFGVDIEINSPFYRWSDAREVLREGFSKNQLKFNANQAKSAWLDVFAQWHAHIINMFFTIFYKHVNPKTGTHLRSNRILNALFARLGPTIKNLAMGISGTPYLLWTAKILEDGGVIKPTRSKMLTIPERADFVAHSPPWKRARLHRRAVLIPMRTRAGITPVIAERLPGNKLDILYWGAGVEHWETGKLNPRSQEPVFISGRNYWADSIRHLQSQMNLSAMKMNASIKEIWTGKQKVTGPQTTVLKIRDFTKEFGERGRYMTAQSLIRLPGFTIPMKTYTIGTETVAPRRTGRPPLYEASVFNLDIKTLVTPAQIKRELKRLRFS